MPNGGHEGQMSGHKASTINSGSDEAVGPREVTFTFGAGDLTRGSIGTQLLILPRFGLTAICAG